MTDPRVFEDIRAAWLRHRADNRKRLEIAQREIARADAELDAIDDQIAKLRLEAAEALLKSEAAV